MIGSADTEFCLEYEHHGKKWALCFFAIDYADAVEKVESVKASLTLLGQLACRTTSAAEAAAFINGAAPPVH